MTINNSVAYQRVEGDTFLDKLNEHRELMITKGTPEEDINIIPNYPNDEDINQSFFQNMVWS